MSLIKKRFGRLKPENCEELIHFFEAYPEKIKFWSNSNFWTIENEDCYSQWFLEEVSRLRLIINEFIENGYTKDTCSKQGSNYPFLRDLAYWVSKTENIITALFKANGWQGRIGLEIAIAELRLFYKQNGRKPTQRDHRMDRILKILSKKGYWRNFGLNNWNDMLEYVFGKVNHEMNYHTGEEGLKRAKQELVLFFENYSRKPTTRDKGMIAITQAIIRGVWKEFGIDSWNVLLDDVFGEINKSSVLYRGINGLEYAKNELKVFFETYKRKPRANDEGMLGISKAIVRGFWEEFGIKTWNDLLLEVFGEVNQRKQLYRGQEGLERAKRKLLDFREQHGRKPTKRDKKMGGIEKACRKGYWKHYDITSWNSLLFYVFGEVNQRKKKSSSK